MKALQDIAKEAGALLKRRNDIYAEEAYYYPDEFKLQGEMLIGDFDELLEEIDKIEGWLGRYKAILNHSKRTTKDWFGVTDAR